MRWSDGMGCFRRWRRGGERDAFALLTQHALKERTGERFDKGIDARYAIHPVSGRIPGHTVLLRGARSWFPLMRGKRRSPGAGPGQTIAALTGGWWLTVSSR